jgi:oligoendopeptidase F
MFCDYEEFDFDAYRKLNKLDIYAHMIEDENERDKQIENFITRLFTVNTEAAKNAQALKRALDLRPAKKNWLKSKIFGL